MKQKTVSIEICMGSSCFSRGNKLSLPVIQSLIKENHLNADIDLAGKLCSENCSKGPVIVINEKRYERVHPDSVKDLILHVIREVENE